MRGKGWELEIIYFDRLESTQRYLTEAIKYGELSAPVAVIASEQSAGIGSRGNRWEGGAGNLYTSIALKESSMPNDLPLISASLYFGWIMREILYSYDNRVWLKWPNDIYLDDEKIGGVITNKISDNFVVGIGINMKRGSNSYSAVELETEPFELLREYINALSDTPSWKSIFSKYRLEFEKSRSRVTHFEGEIVEMSDTILCDDGSLMKNGERIVNLR